MKDFCRIWKSLTTFFSPSFPPAFGGGKTSILERQQRIPLLIPLTFLPPLKTRLSRNLWGVFDSWWHLFSWQNFMPTSGWKSWKDFLKESGFHVEEAKKNNQNHWEYRCYSKDCPIIYRNGSEHSEPTRVWKGEAKRAIEKCREWAARAVVDAGAKSTTALAAQSKPNNKKKRSSQFQIEAVRYS